MLRLFHLSKLYVVTIPEKYISKCSAVSRTRKKITKLANVSLGQITTVTHTTQLPSFRR